MGITRSTEKPKTTTESPVFETSKEPYDPAQPVSAIIVGTGIAGIATAVLLKAKVPNLDLTIIERLPRVGGTWEENHYPGVRCDIPSHAYQLSFDPNPSWSEFFARGPEIRKYYQDVFTKHGLVTLTRFSTTVTSATWNPKSSYWSVSLLDRITNTPSEITANVLISATGKLNRAQLPDIPGISTFAGPVVHTAAWHDALDVSNKRIAIIGNGASGMQILPALLAASASLVHFARTPNWVSTAFNKTLEAHAAAGENPGSHQFTPEEIAEFKEKPEKYLAYRRELYAAFHQGFDALYLGSPASEAFRKQLTENMHRQANGSEKLLPRIVPEYAPGCKRLTPGPGYLEALLDQKTTYEQSPIAEITPTGITTVDGSHYELDIIVAATGFPARAAPSFPVTGRHGTLADAWISPYPKSYFGVMAPGFPNYFFVAGPQGTALGGTVPLHNENAATYIARCIRKIASQSYASLEPSVEATEDFDEVVEAFFKDKVMRDSCGGWWKQGVGKKRVVVMWPGSGHHKWDVSREPRWEDFEFVRKKGVTNRFAYFGSGLTRKEEDGGVEVVTNYLAQVGKVDLKTVHEDWTLGYIDQGLT